MNLSQRRIRHAVDGAHLRAHDVLEDASDGADALMDHGRRLGRRGSSRMRAGARRARDAAGELGSRARHQALRAGRQVQRHPLASLGIAVAAVAGATALTLLARRALQRRRQEMDTTPVRDYFGDGEN